MFNRRTFLATSSAAALASCSGLDLRSTAPPSFVSREGTQLLRGLAPYRIVGANMWYAAWLGANADYGNRARLTRELDRLAGLGINNLRIMASGEEGPLNNSIKPGFTREDGTPNPVLFEGLDFALAEMEKRGMTAVLVLSNFWEWSGGLQTLLWRATGKYTDMGDPAHPWPEFADATAEFYANPRAVALYHGHVTNLLTRTNSITGIPYAEDDTVMSWQLANEPRPGGSEAAIQRNLQAYYGWIEKTAALIRSKAPRQLVSLGQEGTQATNGNEAIVARAHRDVDYVTAHIWPLNWNWVAGDDLAGTWANGKKLTEQYLGIHEDIAAGLNKPLLIEEFGFPRDGEASSPAATTEFREQFYRTIYDAVETSWRQAGPIMGSNFWAWNGEARAAHSDARFRPGDLVYMGDPPHEPQGWYGNFDSDAAMADVIRKHAALDCVGIDGKCLT